MIAKHIRRGYKCSYRQGCIRCDRRLGALGIFTVLTCRERVAATLPLVGVSFLGRPLLCSLGIVFHEGRNRVLIPLRRSWRKSLSSS